MKLNCLFLYWKVAYKGKLFLLNHFQANLCLKNKCLDVRCICGTGSYDFWGFIFETLMSLKHSKKPPTLLNSDFILASLITCMKGHCLDTVKKTLPQCAS